MRDQISGSSQTIEVFVNGEPVRMRKGAMVVNALLNAGVACRLSIDGEPRTALCGMGICFECRAKVNGVSHQRTCQIECREGMTVETER
jgi:hypothetical protein